MKKRKKIPLPADIILDLINDEPRADIRVLNFYEGYILAMAKESKFNANGEFVCSVVNEDLAQELRIALYRSLPKLRRAFFREFGNKPVVVMVSKNK